MNPRSLILHPFEVHAILDGRLTQLRRPVKGIVEEPGQYSEEKWQQGHFPKCPLGKVGESVVGKETWKFGSRWANDKEQGAVISYAENRTVCVHLPYEEYASIVQKDGPKYRKWKDTPSISPSSMPAWASRITLNLTAIRVERLQEISEADAEMCGFSITCDPGFEYQGKTPAKENFQATWDKLYAKKGHGCDSNPWVWVYGVLPEVKR